MSGSKTLFMGPPPVSVRPGAAFLVLALAVVVAALAAPAPAAEWFLDPNGSPTGAGTIGDPWDISVLNPAGASPISPGDTVWFRGGTYFHTDRLYNNQGFDIKIAGSAGNQVTLRNYDDERAIIDPGITLIPGAAYLDIWGLEIRVAENMDPNASRRSANEWSGAPATSYYDPNGDITFYIPQGGIHCEAGTDIRLINNYVHHGSYNAVWLHPALSGDIVVSGNVIRDTGFIGYRPKGPTGNPDGHYGGGIFGGNTSGTMWYINQNIVEENFSYPINSRGYSSTACSDITYQGNYFKTPWVTPDPDQQGWDLSFIAVGGGGDSPENHIFDQNIQYGTDIRFSDQAYVWDAGPIETYDNTFTDNYVIRGQINYLDNPTDPNVRPTIHHNLTTSGNVEWDDPNYDLDPNVDPDPNDYAPPAWTDPPIVDLRVNDFESYRAHLAIVQPGGSAGSIAVNFGSWLSNGQAFELRDPADLWGAPVFTGTYAGSDVLVPVGGAEYSSFVAFRVIPGDFDKDGSITADDVDMLWPRFGTSMPPTADKYDLTSDSQVTFADAEELVEVIVGTSMADTNLDRIVNLPDLGNLANRYQMTGTFSDGDTDGNGFINLMDLGNLANDYGKTYSPPVPEPATLALLALGGLAVIRRRR